MEDNRILLSVCVPCFGRPERTKRLMEQILAQDFEGYQVYMIGDGCPDFQKLIDELYFSNVISSGRIGSNILTYANMPIHKGGWGYDIRNRVKQLAVGKYFMYLDNDDCIKPNHFTHYYNGIKDTDLDFVYFNTFIQPTKQMRVPSLSYGYIGHSELIIRTDFLKTMPPHQPEYGHDWKLIQEMMRMGKHEKAKSKEATYIVMSTASAREQGIN